MIFLTVGSELPFDRLVKTVDEWATINNRNDIIGQISDLGASSYQPKKIKYESFISVEKYNQYCDEAELIIGHAGMGSIITALLKKKPIIIMPRQAILNEHRNDHQLATAEMFAMRKGVFVAINESEIGPLLEKLTISKPTNNFEYVGEYAEERLIQEIRNFILDY